MSGLIMACSRSAGPPIISGDDLRVLATRLVPDHIQAHEPRIVERPGLTVAVVNPMPDLPHAPTAVCLGALLSPDEGWSRPGSGRPDGSYLLCRFDDDVVELVTDGLATRSVWYVHTPDLFLASTSQRALVSLLGDLRFNDEAAAWLLSAGNLGPDKPWDTRLRRVPAAGVCTLDRRRWQVRVAAQEHEAKPLDLPDDEHLRRWRDVIVSSCAKIGLSLDTWLLPLSGGLDSRALLAGFVEAGRRPRCVTWGLPGSFERPDSDAAVAERVADHYDVEHQHVDIHLGGTPPGVLLQRLLVAGEGRTDDIGGYLDGLTVWKDFFDAGVTGIVRGDEPGWGYDVPVSEAYARRSNRLEAVADYPPTHPIRRLGLADQTLPDWALRRPGESLLLYDNRLTDHYFPFTMSPLNDIKCAYVEVVNPFVTDRMLQVARALPEHLRADRRGFEAVVASLAPPLPTAKRGGIAGLTSALSAQPLLDEIVAELSSEAAECICDRRGLDLVLSRLSRPDAGDSRHRARRLVRKVVPRRMRVAVNPDPPSNVTTVRLAFRICLASRMAQLLEVDATVLRTAAGACGRLSEAADGSATRLEASRRRRV